jgi:hypothetical protein
MLVKDSTGKVVGSYFIAVAATMIVVEPTVAAAPRADAGRVRCIGWVST